MSEIQLATSVSVKNRKKGEINCWNVFKVLVLYVTYSVCLITVYLIVIHYFKRERITEKEKKRRTEKERDKGERKKW